MRKLKLVLTTILAASSLLATSSAAFADTILWVDDTSGNIGKVDLTTLSVSNVVSTGLGLTDIGFNSSGTLYGNTFTNLYSINTTTGAPTSLGAFNVGSGGINALVGGGGGNLLAASNSTTGIYNVNPSSPSSSTTFAVSPLASAGDLAFSGNTLYESGVGTGGVDDLVNVTNGNIVGAFSQGSTHFGGVFGLADDGTTMYAVNGTEVYSVNLTTAALTPLYDYAGHGLGAANGTAFFGEGPVSLPEPASLALLGVALLGAGFVRRRNVV